MILLGDDLRAGGAPELGCDSAFSSRSLSSRLAAASGSSAMAFGAPFVVRVAEVSGADGAGPAGGGTACDVRDAASDEVALGSTIVSTAKSAPITTTMASRSTSSLPPRAKLSRAPAFDIAREGAIAELGDLGILAEQNPGETALAFYLFEHLWPEAAVGDGDRPPAQRPGQIGRPERKRGAAALLGSA